MRYLASEGKSKVASGMFIPKCASVFASQGIHAAQPGVTSPVGLARASRFCDDISAREITIAVASGTDDLESRSF